MEFTPPPYDFPVLALGGSRRVELWELRDTPERLLTLEASDPARFSGGYLFVNHENQLQVWDWRNQTQIQSQPIPEYFAVSHDSSVALTWQSETGGIFSGQISIWDMSSLFTPKPVLLGQVKKTALLPNFPNPLNPETWMPYQLGEPTHVRIQIHDVSGRLVRTLDLGTKAAGNYLSRSQAAYWDGRNSAGESVSSGLYFYHLNAGEFTKTQRMLVQK